MFFRGVRQSKEYVYSSININQCSTCVYENTHIDITVQTHEVTIIIVLLYTRTIFPPSSLHVCVPLPVLATNTEHTRPLEFRQMIWLRGR